MRVMCLCLCLLSHCLALSTRTSIIAYRPSSHLVRRLGPPPPPLPCLACPGLHTQRPSVNGQRTYLARSGFNIRHVLGLLTEHFEGIHSSIPNRPPSTNTSTKYQPIFPHANRPSRYTSHNMSERDVERIDPPFRRVSLGLGYAVACAARPLGALHLVNRARFQTLCFAPPPANAKYQCQCQCQCQCSPRQRLHPWTTSLLCH